MIKDITCFSGIGGIFVASSVAFLCYVNTFKADFAYDDNRAILENADILSDTPWRNIWKNDFWGTPLSHTGSHKSFRPLTVLSFRWNYYLDQLNPTGYHLLNVLLHSIMVGLFHLLAYTLLGSSVQSIFASLLFAVHPIHTEAVAGIVGRADVLASIFFTLSLISYKKASSHANTPTDVASNRSTNMRCLFMSVLFAVAAMLCKETGLTVLAVCAVYDVIFVAEPRLPCWKGTLARAKARGTLFRIFALLLSSVGAIFWRLVIMDLSVPHFNMADNPAANHSNFKVRFLTFLYLPVLNFYLLLFPCELSFDWSMDAIELVTSFSDARCVETFLFYAFLLTMLIKYIRNLSTDAVGDSTKSPSYLVDSCWSVESKAADSRSPQDSSSSNEISKPLVRLSGFKFNCMMSDGHRSDICNPKMRLLQFGSSSNGDVNNGVTVQQGYTRNDKNSNHELAKMKVEQSSERAHAKNGHCSQKRNGYATNGVFERSMKNKKRESGSELYASPNEDASQLNESFDVAVFSVAIMIISYLPASNIFFYVGFVVAERVLYIPSIGLCLLVAVSFGRIWNSGFRIRSCLVFLCGILIGLFAIRTIVRNEDWRNEEALYRSGVNINPAKAWGNLGNILSQQGKLSQAEQAYRTALKVRPNMADAHYNLGVLLQSMKRYKESIECYRSAINYRPQLASAHLNLGLVFDNIGRKNEALQILQNSSNISDRGLKSPKAHHISLTSIRYNIGRILFEFGKYKESIEAFHDAIQKMPGSYAAHSLYNMLGQSYSFTGALKLAEHWYLQSLKSNNTHVPAHLTYARHLALTGNLKEAEGWFLKAIKLQPESPEGHFHYADFLYKNGRLQEAIASIENCLKFNPNEIDGILLAASCYREAKIYPKAELHYQKAVSLYPDKSDYHMNLGAIYHLTGRLDDAKSSYLEAIRLNPGDKLTITNLRKLESMQRRVHTMN